MTSGTAIAMQSVRWAADVLIFIKVVGYLGKASATAWAPSVLVRPEIPTYISRPEIWNDMLRFRPLLYKMRLNVATYSLRQLMNGWNVLITQVCRPSWVQPHDLMAISIYIYIMCYQYISAPILTIRWSHVHLIFIMEIPFPGKTAFILRWGPLVVNRSLNPARYC